MSRKITEETGQSELFEMSLAIERMKEEKGLILMSISLVLQSIIV